MSSRTTAWPASSIATKFSPPPGGTTSASRLAEDETVGPLELYLLPGGCRDAELIPLPTQASQPQADAGASANE